MHHLCGDFPSHLAESLGANEEVCFRFWDRLRSSKHGPTLWAEHQWLRHFSPRELSRTLPIRIFEDGGPYTKKQSAQNLVFSSLFGKGAELDTRFVLGCHAKHKGVSTKVGSDDAAWRLVIASFRILAFKELPPIGPYHPTSIEFKMLQLGFVLKLAGQRWGLMPLFSQQDLEQLTVGFGLRSYNAAGKCCGYCPADRDLFPFTNLHEDSPWRGIVYTVQDFTSQMTTGHPLADSPFMSRYLFRIDLMHAYDSHGIIAIGGGSLLRSIVEERRFGPNQASRLGVINADLSEFYRTTRVSSRVPPIRLSNLSLDGKAGDSSFSVLHGPGFKAANTRQLMPFFIILAAKFFPGQSQYEKSLRNFS